MRVILAIAANTFREVVRQRLFLLVISLTVVAVALMLLFPFFTFREDTEMYKDLSLSTVTLAMVFLVALGASSAMAEELDSRTAMTVLSKPVARWQFLLGKYLGTLAALAAATAILAVVLFVAVYMRVYFDALPRDRRLAFTFSQSQPAQAFQRTMLGHALATVPGSVTVLLQGAVLAAVAVVLASRFSRVLAVIATFGLFLVGHLLDFLQAAARTWSDSARALADWVVDLFPALEALNLSSRLSHMTLVPGTPEWAHIWAYTGLAAIYAAIYTAFILLIGVVLLRTREID